MNVAAPIDVDDLDGRFVVVDRVDGAVVAPPSGVEADQLVTKGLSDPPGIVGRRSDDEFDARDGDLLR